MADDRADLIQQIKQANDVVDVVGAYIPLRPAGPTFKGLCPFHDDNRPSFDVDPRRQRYRCWACGKHGDVISFVQEHERVSFNEALELLARRAGISLEKNGDFRQNESRARMLDVMRWACEQFHNCLIDDAAAEQARRYLGERQLKPDTIRRFGIGFAPVGGDWLVQQARKAGLHFEMLEKVGLVAQRLEGRGYYDRFRDRVMFPIRDAGGRTVAFGGRVLPSSPLSARGPKYYNSSETPLFKKSEQLYGLDLARHAAAKAGYLAVVEGYTDVLMAHQLGVGQVVATMGTALNERHVAQLRRFAPRVVLVFDADEGGEGGVDRALEIFVSQEVDLSVAALPEGLDPFDLLVRQGAAPFVSALTNATDVLEFKLNRVWAAGTDGGGGVESRRRAVEEVLRVIALAPDLPGQVGAVKQELMVTRIAHRFALKEETVWARLRELRAARREREAPRREAAPVVRSAPASRLERDLLAVLLAEPGLVPKAAAEVAPGDVEHPGLRKLLEGLYQLLAEGSRPELDLLRPRIDNAALASKALELQEEGLSFPDRAGCLDKALSEYNARRTALEKQAIERKLKQVPDDHAAALELLRQRMNPPGG